MHPSGLPVTFTAVDMKPMQTPRLCSRFICFSLALLVLLSSTGFGTVEHWCQMRGHTKSLLAVSTTCAKFCPSDEISDPVVGGHTIKKMPCCKTILSYQHLDVSSFVADQGSITAPQPAGFMPAPAFRLLLAAIAPIDARPATAIRADDPQPRTGRYRLISLCTWLI